MRVALVHDWLDRPMGGAERVLLELAALYPEAPVYALLHDPGRYGAVLDSDRVRTSWLQRLPAAARSRPRYLLPLIPGAVEQWDFSAFDVVLSSSSAFVKNILTPPGTQHVCYCHAPMRFAWDYWPRYLDEMHAGPLRQLAIRTLVSRLRVWDRSGVDRVDVWLCNSETTRLRIEKYYRVQASVIHPPVRVSAAPAALERRGYVTLSTLTEYKRIDLAIEAFRRIDRPLTVIGDGPLRGRLETLAAGATNITFAGHVDDAERTRLLAGALALVFPNEEDFGIAPVEALACGTPVIAYGRGGVAETVEDGRTGVLFTEQTADALQRAVRRLDDLDLDTAGMTAAAARFSPERFRAEVASAVRDAAAQQRQR